MSREAFVAMMTTDMPEAPAYFSRDAQMNLEGPPLLSELAPPKPLAPAEVKNLQDSGTLVFDTRSSQDYANGHDPGSLNIGLAGQFASWAGSLIPLDKSIVIVSQDESGVREAQIRLARVGIERVVGYLNGGVLEWDNAGMPLATIDQISVQELKDRIAANRLGNLVDVRRPNEWNNGHIPEAQNVPLNHLSENIRYMDPNISIAVICAGGYRSSIAASIFEQHGFTHIFNVVGGMAAWQNAGL